MLKSEDFALLLVLLWNIWFNRNRARLGKLLYNPMEVVEFAKNYLQRYRKACASELENDPFSSSVRWKLPAQGYVKIHFDGARFDNIAASGIGIIVRKSLWRFFGSVVQAFSLFLYS